MKNRKTKPTDAGSVRHFVSWPSIVLIALIIAISGCVGIPNIFGRDVISVQKSVVENGVKDVIVVRDIYTIPKSPLLPDQQVMLSFLVENRDTVKSSIAVVDLFNAPTMRSIVAPNDPCNYYAVGGAAARFCLPDQCAWPGGCNILPGEEKPINIKMMTPSERDIQNIRTQTKLDFKTAYDFDGALNYLVPAVNGEEITKRQRAGEKTSLFTTKSHSSGPVQIDVELQGAPYMLDQLDAVMFFKIKNRGSGTLENSQIDAGKMEILFPPEFDVDTARSSEKFTCTPDPATGGTRCVNDGRGNPLDGVIPIYKDESRSSLMFTVSLLRPLAEPFRSFQITSTVKYKYELRNNVEITVNPFNNA